MAHADSMLQFIQFGQKRRRQFRTAILGQDQIEVKSPKCDLVRLRIT